VIQAALAAARLRLGGCFQVFLVEPLAKHAHSALDSTLDYAVRDYDDKSSMKIRGQVCNGFRTESSRMYIVKREGIDGTEARVIQCTKQNKNAINP
jgi:hypothetical protein